MAQPALAPAKFFSLGDGKRMRYALFEPENARATILIAPGRREFIEKKYAELGPEFLKRNYRVIIFEWRAQGLSDRYLTGAKKQRDYMPDFNIHLGDLGYFYEKIIRPLQIGPLFIAGHSMGAHLLLRWLIEQKPKVAAAILTAPMMALAGKTAHTMAEWITRGAVRLGHGADYAAAQHDYGPNDKNFENNPLTQDPDRFAIMEKYFTAYPEMTMGGVTWAWMDAALKSMHHITPARYFKNLTLPTLTITGAADRVTPPDEINRYLKRIPTAENIIIPGARHDIMNELDIYRLEAWQQIDRFLNRVRAAG